MNDATLEGLLATAGSAYDVPEGAFARVLEAAGESAVPVRRRFEHRRLAAAGVLLVAAVGSALLWSGHTVGAGGAHQVDEAGPTNSAKLPVGAAASKAGPFTNDCVDCHGAAGGSGTRALAGGAVATQRAPAPAPVKGLTTGSADNSSASSVDEAKIVHTGTLMLSVAKGQVSATLTGLTGLATGSGGYVSSSTTAETGSKPSGTVVLRVPAAAYDRVLTQARAYGTVVSTASAAQDVTAQAADQQARLTALKASRDQFLTILAKAKTIGETLAVQQRVDDTQTQIDQLQGQINVLASQASYGTLTVTVSQKTPSAVAVKPEQRRSGLSKAWHSAVTGFVTGVEALVARSGRGLLVVLVLLLAAGMLRVGWRVGRRRFV